MQSVCSGEALTCVCATGNSNTLAWAIDRNRLEFASSDPLFISHSVDGFGTLTGRYNRTGVEVITSNLSVTASTEDTRLQIQCENVDGSTSNSITIPVLRKYLLMLGIREHHKLLFLFNSGFIAVYDVITDICCVVHAEENCPVTTPPGTEPAPSKRTLVPVNYLQEIHPNPIYVVAFSRSF